MPKQSGTPEPQPNAGRQPSGEDVAAIANAAQASAVTSAESGGTPEQAGDAAAEAARAEAARREIHLPDEVVQQIARASATAVVAELASQGALTSGEPEAEPAAPAGEPPAPPAPVTPDEPPRKQTLAAKVLAGYNR